MCGDVETLNCLLTVDIDIENMVNITLINIYIDKLIFLLIMVFISPVFDIYK